MPVAALVYLKQLDRDGILQQVSLQRQVGLFWQCHVSDEGGDPQRLHTILSRVSFDPPLSVSSPSIRLSDEHNTIDL